MTDDNNWKSEKNIIIDKVFEQERKPLVKVCKSDSSAGLSGKEVQRKIFLKLSLEERLQERIEELRNRMYSFNADISLNFIGMKTKPTIKSIERINFEIGEWIGELKNLKSSLMHEQKCVEITSEELELLKNNTICVIENGRLDHKMTTKQEALLKKLEDFSEGFGEEEATKSSLEESK